jgi:hypothetical protein
MALVEVRGVTKEYRKGEQKITPLKEVDLDVEKGEYNILANRHLIVEPAECRTTASTSCT